MKTGQAGIDLIKSFEGCYLTAYKCPAGVWTIGYGHTNGVKQGQKISQSQALALLAQDLIKYEAHVMKYNAKYNWSQNEFDALVSFAFNIGNINQLVANGTRDKKTIAAKILEYNKAKGKVLSGLTRRRIAERNLFLSGSNTINYKKTTIKYGSKNEEVKELQQFLKNKGYNPGKVDGIFGKLTEDAVIMFQKDNMLAPDGIVGPLTWTEIMK